MIITNDIVDLIDKRIKKYIDGLNLYRRVPATVASGEVDGYADVRLVGDVTSKDFKLLNKTGEILSVGDSVWVAYTGILTSSSGFIERRNSAASKANSCVWVNLPSPARNSVKLPESDAPLMQPGDTIDKSVFVGNCYMLGDGDDFNMCDSLVLSYGDVGGIAFRRDGKFLNAADGISGSRPVTGSVICGAGHYVYQASESLVCGLGNEFRSSNSIISGMMHQAKRTDVFDIAYIQDSIIGGEGFGYTCDIKGCIVGGTGNSVRGMESGLRYITTKDSIVCGENNEFFGFQNGIMCGTFNNSAARESQEGVLVDSPSYQSIVCGYGNEFYDFNNGIMCGVHCAISNPYKYIVVGNGSDDFPHTTFSVDCNGNVYADGQLNTSGADYAEFHEWKDGNPEKQDRRGLFVTFDGDKIRPATEYDDYILGVVSGSPAVVGNSYEDEWCGKFETDIYGTPVFVEVEDDYSGYKAKRTIRKVSDSYDPNKPYVPRSKRPEYDYVGSHGKLVVVDDGTCEANSYCYPKSGGVATKCTDPSRGYRVLKRLDENHISIWVK